MARKKKIVENDVEKVVENGVKNCESCKHWNKKDLHCEHDSNKIIAIARRHEQLRYLITRPVKACRYYNV